MARKTLRPRARQHPAPRRRRCATEAPAAAEAPTRPARAPRKEKRPAKTRPTTRARAAKVPPTPAAKIPPTEFEPRMPGERVLALDTSSRCIGWSLYDDGALRDAGKYPLTPKGHGAKRLAFRAWLAALLARRKPHQLVVEQPYAGRFKGTFAILTRYVGVVEDVHVEHFGAEMPRENQVPAHAVKRAIGARRVKAPTADAAHRLNKRTVVDLVNRAYGLDLAYVEGDDAKKASEDDQADAIAVNWAWHLLHRAPRGADDAAD